MLSRRQTLPKTLLIGMPIIFNSFQSSSLEKMCSADFVEGFYDQHLEIFLLFCRALPSACIFHYNQINTVDAHNKIILEGEARGGEIFNSPKKSSVPSL